MLHFANSKAAIIAWPTSTATNATATGNLDTKGYHFARVDVLLDTQAATSSNPAVLNLLESDDTVATNFAAFATGDTDFTIPNADTSSRQIFSFFVDLRKRKRYLRVAIKPAGASQVVGATATMYRPSQTPDSGGVAGKHSV